MRDLLTTRLAVVVIRHAGGALWLWQAGRAMPGTAKTPAAGTRMMPRVRYLAGGSQ